MVMQSFSHLGILIHLARGAHGWQQTLLTYRGENKESNIYIIYKLSCNCLYSKTGNVAHLVLDFYM